MLQLSSSSFEETLVQLSHQLKTLLEETRETSLWEEQISQWVEKLQSLTYRCHEKQRRLMVRKISDDLAAYQQNPNTRQKMPQFKSLLQAIWKQKVGRDNWKEAILQPEQPLLRIHSLFKIPLSYSNDAALSTKSGADKRFVLQRASKVGLQNYSVVLAGSTFLTNQPSARQDKGQMVLDAIYASYTVDIGGKIDGAILAVADGSGGHFSDTFQDIQIARAAHFGTKQAVRLLHSLTRPQSFDRATLTEWIEDIKQEISIKAKLDSSTTLLAVRFFREKEGWRWVGFNVGDSFLLMWDKRQKKLSTLIPACEMAQGTALLPGPYKPDEIHYYAPETCLPSDLILFPLTDGVGDVLEQKAERKQYSEGTEYQAYTIEDAELTRRLALIPISASITQYIDVIQKLLIERNDQKRIEQVQTQKEIQLGDDLILGAIDLSVSFLPTVRACEEEKPTCSIF